MIAITRTKTSLFRTIPLALGAAAAIALAACGGGGSDSAPSSAQGKPEGAYRGSLSDGGSFSTVILDNNQAYALIGVVDTNGVLRVSALVDVIGNVTGNTFTSGDARQYQFDGQVFTGSVNATFSPKTSFSGTTVIAGRSGSFTGTGVPLAEYNYDTPAATSQIAGAWRGELMSGEGFSITISSTGTVSGSSQFGCQFSGTITPRPGGKAIFDVALTFGASPCAAPSQIARGIALVTRLTSGQSQLLVAGANSARTFGTVAFATR